MQADLNSNDFLEFSAAVVAARQNGAALVALESTIISHGMPYPKNLETALMVENEVRRAGAVPATCAVINGRLKVGLESSEMELLAKSGQKTVKASRRDLNWLVSSKLTGATTVAATMILAQMAGIEIFATGGIGGVHRGAEKDFDISSDLNELARTRVAVVAAGFKSILDLALTREYLETGGVPIIGYRTDRLPAFFSKDSPFMVDYRVDTVDELADYILSGSQLNLDSGSLIANPIPDTHSLEFEQIEAVIQQAINDAGRQRISGKQMTPFLLERVNQLSDGKSLAANIALVLNNAALAAEVAVAMRRKYSASEKF